MVSKLFKKYYNKNCTHNTFSMPNTITQISLDDWIEKEMREDEERKTQSQKQ